MTQRTRYFLVGSSLVVVVALCTGLVAYYNDGLVRRVDGPAELAYLPPGVSAVAYADVRDIMSSEFHQKMRAAMSGAQGKDPVLEATGIDIEHDIDAVLAAFPGPIVLVRGRFNEASIESLATEHGARADEYGGDKLLVLPAEPDSTSDPSPTVVAFLAPGVLAVGNRASVQQAIDSASTHHDVTSDADLMKLVSGVESNGNAWVVGRFDAIAHNPLIPADVRSKLPPIEWFALSAQVDQNIRGEVHAEAADDASGEQLRSAVNGALSAVHLMAGQDPKLDTLLNSLQARGTGREVTVSFTVPTDVLQGLNGPVATALAH